MTNEEISKNLSSKDNQNRYKYLTLLKAELERRKIEARLQQEVVNTTKITLNDLVELRKDLGKSIDTQRQKLGIANITAPPDKLYENMRSSRSEYLSSMESLRSVLPHVDLEKLLSLNDKQLKERKDLNLTEEQQKLISEVRKTAEKVENAEYQIDLFLKGIDNTGKILSPLERLILDYDKSVAEFAKDSSGENFRKMQESASKANLAYLNQTYEAQNKVISELGNGVELQGFLAENNIAILNNELKVLDKNQGNYSSISEYQTEILIKTIKIQKIEQQRLAAQLQLEKDRMEMSKRERTAVSSREFGGIGTTDFLLRKTNPFYSFTKAIESSKKSLDMEIKQIERDRDIQIENLRLLSESNIIQKDLSSKIKRVERYHSWILF